jgi:hypothetical protein
VDVKYGFETTFLGFADGVVLNEVGKAEMLILGKRTKFQADAAHFNRAETKLALDFEIRDFLNWNLVHAQTAAAQYDFQLSGF